MMGGGRRMNLKYLNHAQIVNKKNVLINEKKNKGGPEDQ